MIGGTPCRVRTSSSRALTLVLTIADSIRNESDEVESCETGLSLSASLIRSLLSIVDLAGTSNSEHNRLQVRQIYHQGRCSFGGMVKL